VRVSRHGGTNDLIIRHTPLVTAALAAMVSLRLGNGACSVLEDKKCESLAPSYRRSLIVVEFEYCLGDNDAVVLGYSDAAVAAPSCCRACNDAEFWKLKGAACVDESRRAKRDVRKQRNCIIVTCGL
jgi:hypothetical protein